MLRDLTNGIFLLTLSLSAGAAFGQSATDTHWEPYLNGNWTPSEDQELTDPILQGAIDLHVHSGPDAYPRQWDAFEVARIAESRGMRGIVLKNHWTETAGLAAMVSDTVPETFEVFGALALNTTVGGLNVRALKYMAAVSGGRGKVVWMPTHESEHEVAVDGTTRPSVPVSRGGELLDEVLAILDLIAEHDLTLATGHVTPSETLSIMREARARGIERIIVTHPTLGEQYTYMSDEELSEAVELGGVIEITAGSLYRGGQGRDRALEVIELVGPENTFVGSDSGLIGTPNVPDALVMAARELREAGYAESDLEQMFKGNPARLLGLSTISH
ncbi:MAG: DUF6282 family protein [Gammaproteobacteria bacterium]